MQTKLGNSATSYLQNKYDVDINIEKVDLSFLGSVQLKEVYIQDHHADTLIYVHDLTSSLYSFSKILKNKLEFGNIELRNFNLYIKTYKGEKVDALTVFIDKFNKGATHNKPSSFKLTSDEILLNKGYVAVINENIENEKPIFFKNISGLGSNFKVEGPNVNVKIKDFSFIENHGIKAKSFSSDFQYTKTSMQFLNSHLETETSELDADIRFLYKLKDFSNFNNKVNIDAKITKADVSLIDLKKFYNEIGTEDVLHFTSKISGQLNNLKLKNLKLSTDKHAIVEGDVNLKNSFNTKNGFSMNADFERLTSDYKHLKIVLPRLLGETLPTSFADLGRFTLKGKTFITTNLINANVAIDTDIGSVLSDIKLTNIQHIENASYAGHVKIIDFKLGQMLQDSLIGQLSMEADVKGKGFTFESLNTSVKGTVSKYQYKNYNYSNISLNGVFTNKHFNGEMEVNDDNIKLNFNGLADLSTQVYKFDFKTTVDYCDLNKINLFKRDSISNLNGVIEIDVKGNSFDDLVGTINIKNSLYTNQKDQYFFKDFTITSSFKEEVRTIGINSSEIIEGFIKGKFKFSELGRLTQNSLGSNYINYKPFEVTPNQNLSFKFEIYNKIVEVFLPEVVLSPKTIISGDIDSDKNLFKLNVKSPKVVAYSTIINAVNLQVNNKNPLFNTQLTINKIKSKIYNLYDLHLVNKTLNDTLYFGANFKGGKKGAEKFNLSFYHTFNKENKSVIGIRKSNINYKNNKWLINPKNNSENKVVYDNHTKTYTFTPFSISSKKQTINFSGIINDTISKDLKFKFKNVNIADITPKIDSLNLKGLINGELNYSEVNRQIKPTMNLTVSNFNINNSQQGNLKVNIEGKNSLKQYALDISLKRNNEVNFSAKGDLNFEKTNPEMDVVVDFEGFKLDAFSPLGEDVFNKIRGYAYGSAHLTGLTANPIMEGELFLDNAGMYFPYLNVDYDFVGTSYITLKDQTFTFEDVSIKDKIKHTNADLKGTLSHQFFKTWNLDLTVNSNNLLVLNTEEEETSLYYGTAFFGGLAAIKGPTDKLVIDIIGKTNKGTHFIVPISDIKTAETSQLVRFINTGEVKEENEKIRKAFISKKLKGLSINFDLDVTKEAVFEMVVDKTSGSFLKGSGSGNLRLELDTKDKFNMYGDFIVDKGVYEFKYGIISKPFDVVKGGNISWNGDVLGAEMNIVAVHRVSANPRTLLENVNTNRKIPIDLITRFSGELFDSTIDFDIEIPNSSSTVASELAFKLNNNKTTQFIALLVSGSFYNEGGIGVNGNTVLYGTGIDALANAFDNILNTPGNKFKLKPEYTVGQKNVVDKYDTNDQFSLAMDYQLNDRIIINGKVGVPIGARNQASVIGELNIEYLINEEGTLRSSLFNRQNDIQYSDEEEGYTQGAGISYQIDFEDGKELLEKLYLKRKKVIDTVHTSQKKDTIIKQKLIKFKNRKNVKNK